ncbi:MAG: ribonuclease R [bacterium]|nr:ribonuclease R [bacterium]
MKRSQKTKSPRHKATSLRGIIRIAGKGLGFFEAVGFKEDILIETENLNTALNKDEVEIALLPKSKNQRLSGKVLKILKRAKNQFVGTLEQDKERFFLVPDDKKMYKDIVLHSNNTLKNSVGMKVLIKFTGWKDPKKNPEGELIKIIGRKGDNNAEMMGIALEKGFDASFSETVEREAEKIAQQAGIISSEELAKRKDFRKTLTFTIDPIDAKDFDDAISFKKLGEDEFEIGVHIADVSHYVKEKTELDREARKRGFSVYLVDRTIPMLPEALSNNVCSLKPNEDRLTFSAVFVLNQDGIVKERWFGKTIIHSAKRFTYEAAQDVLDGKSTEHKEALDTLNGIAKKMRERKFKEGAIDFEQDEVRFELDGSGKPLRIYKKQRLDTHKLVEEYMLLANREVAELIYKSRLKHKSKEPFIYRIHDIPNQEKIVELGIFLRALGHNLPDSGGKVSSKDLQMLFKQIEGRAEESMIKTAAVRSMAKAIYSTGNIGHFGLAFEYYTHFTSPIRRYADLLVHRILYRHLNGTKVPPHEWHSYEKMAQENSEQEIAAAEAERASKKYKQVEYMQDKIGQTFDGIISGVTEWGMYIEEKETRCEGMIKLRDLGDDFYILDQKNYCLVGEKTKKKYSLGDSVRFKVVSADLERKTLDYVLVQN